MVRGSEVVRITNTGLKFPIEGLPVAIDTEGSDSCHTGLSTRVVNAKKFHHILHGPEWGKRRRVRARGLMVKVVSTRTLFFGFR